MDFSTYLQVRICYMYLHTKLHSNVNAPQNNLKERRKNAAETKTTSLRAYLDACWLGKNYGKINIYVLLGKNTISERLRVYVKKMFNQGY